MLCQITPTPANSEKLALWAWTKGKQLTPHRRQQHGTKAGADGFVQGGVFGEVVLGSEFSELEVEDGVGAL